jgi:hypothetical protein
VKTIASNDILEIINIGPEEDFKPRITHNNLMEPDLRAKWSLQIIQAWGMAATFADVMSHDCSNQVKPVPPSELVMRVCEVVDAAWNEMQHRGWILPSKSIEDK